VGNKLKAAADKLDKDAPTLAEAERNRRQRELVEQDRDLQRKRREFQEDLNQRKNEELSSVVERANRVIKQIFEQEKYDLILQEVVFAGPRGHHREGDQGAERRRRGQVRPVRSIAVQVRLGELVAALGGELIGDPALGVIAHLLDRDGRAGIDHLPGTGQIPAPAGPLHRAACVIVSPPTCARRLCSAARPSSRADPYHYHARLTQWWAARAHPRADAGIHASAVVETEAFVHPTARIGPLAFVGQGATVGAHAVIEAQAHVGARARVGEATRLHARAVLADGCVIGARGIIHSGAVIGADGFGFAPHQGRWEKIEQLGIVRIGDDVEIGPTPASIGALWTTP
jgi:tetrahydrodipicolinate N-succinyltransferase